MEAPLFKLKRKPSYPLVVVFFTFIVVATYIKEGKTFPISIHCLLIGLVFLLWLGLYYLYFSFTIYYWGIERKWLFKKVDYTWQEIEGYLLIGEIHDSTFETAKALSIHFILKENQKIKMVSGFFASNITDMLPLLKKYSQKASIPEKHKSFYNQKDHQVIDDNLL